MMSATLIAANNFIITLCIRTQDFRSTSKTGGSIAECGSQRELAIRTAWCEVDVYRLLAPFCFYASTYVLRTEEPSVSIEFINVRECYQITTNYLCRRHNAVVRNHSSEIIPEKRNRLGWNFTGRRRLICDTLPRKRWAPCAKRPQNSGKNAFYEIFVTQTAHRFTHFPAADFREIWTQKV